MTEFDRHPERYGDQVGDAIAFSGAEHEFFLRAKAEHILRLARERLAPEPAVLDVGCGIGLVHALLAELSPRLVGVEVAPATLAQAKQSAPGSHFVRYDGSRLPFRDETFDLVFAVCVLHHVPPQDWPAFSAELGRVTRRGGMVAIFEHNPLNPLTRLVVSRCELDDEAVLLRNGRVRRLLEGSGLGEVEQRHILFFPWEGVFWRSLDHALRWLPLGAQYYVAARKCLSEGKGDPDAEALR